MHIHGGTCRWSCSGIDGDAEIRLADGVTGGDCSAGGADGDVSVGVFVDGFGDAPDADADDGGSQYAKKYEDTDDDEDDLDRTTGFCRRGRGGGSPLLPPPPHADRLARTRNGIVVR